MEDKSIGLLEGKPLFFNLIVLLTLVLSGGLVFGNLGIFTVANLYGIDFATVSNNVGQLNANQTRLLQAFYTIGTFLIPALVFVQLSGNATKTFLPTQKTSVLILFLSIIILLFGAYAVNGLVYLTYSFPYPDFLQNTINSLLAQQELIEQQTQKLLEIQSEKQLWLNLLVIAFLPAVAEEVLFRGVMQTLLIKHFGNIHKAVWITAFAFALLHQTYFYFLGLMVLGAVFGYIRVWTNNIWIAITLHFINNGSLVYLAFYYPQNFNNDASNVNVWIASICLVSLVLAMYLLKILLVKKQ